MTRLECFREELMKNGLNRAQAESKAATVALEILLQRQQEYSDQERLVKENNGLINEIEARKKYIIELQRVKERTEAEINLFVGMRLKPIQEYLDKFFEALNAAETPEARDALRVAQMFVNSVDVNTKYDNTSFIIGLASILSRWNTGAIEQLHAINPKIPTFNPFFLRSILKDEEGVYEI